MPKASACGLARRVGASGRARSGLFPSGQPMPPESGKPGLLIFGALDGSRFLLRVQPPRVLNVLLPHRKVFLLLPSSAGIKLIVWGFHQEPSFWNRFQKHPQNNPARPADFAWLACSPARRLAFSPQGDMSDFIEANWSQQPMFCFMAWVAKRPIHTLVRKVDIPCQTLKSMHFGGKGSLASLPYSSQGAACLRALD